MHPAKFVKLNYRACWYFVFLMSLTPLLILIWEYYSNSLGVNKLDRLTRFTGIWAVNFLLVSLAITPGRRWITTLMIWNSCEYGKRIGDWNFMVQMRRMIGVYSFFYALLHFSIYICLDLGFEWKWIFVEVQEKPYLAAGLIAFVLLIPLVLTSTNSAMRYLGKNWRRLHRIVYLIGIFATLHYLWLSKKGIFDSWYYALILIILLGDRLLIHYGYLKKRPHDNGMETPER